MTSLTKNPHPKQKFFFRVQTRRLAASFETFTGSAEHTRPEKFLRKATCVQAFFFQKSLNPSGRQSVNNKHLRCRLISVWRQPCKQKYCSSKDFQNLQKHFYFYISQFQKPPCSMSSKQISPVSGSTYVDRSRIRW